MSCHCASSIEEQLVEFNTAIDWATMIDPKTGSSKSMLAIKTCKIDAKGRRGPTVLVATYCPFCGGKL